MRVVDFQAAYDRARSLIPKGTWVLLSPREQTDAIYMAMRKLDTEGLTSWNERSSAHS